MRESDDNSTWGAWSDNYTSPLNNDISTFTKDYLQFMAILAMMNKAFVYLRRLGQEHSLAMHTIVCLGA